VLTAPKWTTWPEACGLGDRIQAALLDSPTTIADLAGELGATMDSVKKTIERGEEQGVHPCAGNG